ncbi:O-antigen polymerase [Priestia megaterium]|uniref:O-antigen polymerase n=1 Tax=Priestia megaterium TaxID=1404 RepID=UPI00221F05B6|nr:oligosaccharide repeat unit polymerase [Priestia megaterium]
MFFISTCFAAINFNQWDINLHALTILVILLGLFAFGVGEITTRRMFGKYNKNKSASAKTKISLLQPSMPIEFKKSFLVFLNIFMLFITYMYYRQVLKIAQSVGYTAGSDIPMLKFFRAATLSQNNMDFQGSFIVTQGVILSYGFTYIILYVLIFNILFFGFKKSYVYYFTPIILFLVQAVLTGGRTQFLYLIAASFIISSILFNIKHGWNKRKNAVLIKKFLIIASLVLIAFYCLGTLTGKTETFSFYDTISIYVGSSIVAFDIFLNKGIASGTGLLFGQNTLFGIYDILERFGLGNYHMIKEAAFVNIGPYETNIYTSYMRYILDFSIFGLLMMQFFIGSLFSFIYMVIKTKNKMGFLVIMYAIIFQVIIESPIEERLFMNIFSIGYIIRLTLIYLIFFIMVKKKNNLSIMSRVKKIQVNKCE